MKPILAPLALALLAATAPAQFNHTGTWQISPPVNWDPGFGSCQPIVFDQLVIVDMGSTATVVTSPATFVGTMSGVKSGSSIWATKLISQGQCDFDFTLQLNFQGGNQLSGAFDIDVGGSVFCSCYFDDETFNFSGVCVSPVVSYCTAGTSQNGCTPTLSAAGTASATASSGFTVTATGAEGAKTGIFFFGVNGRQASPWGSGTSFQCVVPPVMRGGLINGTGTAGLCDGTFTQDLNARWCPTCPRPLQNPGNGAIVQAQLWYRDPGNTSNQTTSLSDAIEFAVCN